MAAATSGSGSSPSRAKDPKIVAESQKIFKFFRISGVVLAILCIIGAGIWAASRDSTPQQGPAAQQRPPVERNAFEPPPSGWQERRIARAGDSFEVSSPLPGMKMERGSGPVKGCAVAQVRDPKTGAWKTPIRACAGGFAPTRPLPPGTKMPGEATVDDWTGYDFKYTSVADDEFVYRFKIVPK